MNQRKSDIEGFDYPELDISDEQPLKEDHHDQGPTGEPTKKIKTEQSIFKTNQVQGKPPKLQKQTPKEPQTFRPPLPFFPLPPGPPNKGANTWIPPPPVVQKTSQSQQNLQRPQYQKNQPFHNRENRQKKNTVYVKNIPKSFNTQEKLMTFFKNQGAIKQIKVNQTQQSAMIRFVKQENAAKFLKSNKIIFNRSYIVYGQNENLPVSQQLVNYRINDELGNVKKAQKTNMKVVKEKINNQIAQNIRALYFLQNHLVQDGTNDARNLKNEIQQQIQKKIQNKKTLESQDIQQFKPDIINTSDYNWSLEFIRKTYFTLDKKSLFAQFLKYGPITSLQYECMSEKTLNTAQNQRQGSQISKQLLQYKIKILFLGIKHAWSVYYAKKDELGLLVQGNQLQKYFKSGKLKIIQLKKTQQVEPIQQDLPIELKSENREIQPIKWPEDSQNRKLEIHANKNCFSAENQDNINKDE